MDFCLKDLLLRHHLTYLYRDLEICILIQVVEIFLGLRIGTNKFINRMFATILPSWNPLTNYNSGVMPKGTKIKVGIIGPQCLKYPGESLQFIVHSEEVQKVKSKKN